MPTSEPLTAVTPLTAGLLLAAREVATSHGLPWPSDDEIFAATSANRAGARELEDAISGLLPALARLPSPLHGEPGVVGESQLVAIASAALHLLGTWEDSTRGTHFAAAACAASNADGPRAAKHDATPG